LRGISWTANKFAVETFIDELAAKQGADPVAYRLELIKDPRARKVVETVARMAEWGKKRDGRGMGFSFLNYSDSLVAGAGEVSVDRSTGAIRLHNFWCALDCGRAVQPDNVVAQTESSIVYGLGLALMERITFKDGAVEQSNFYDYPIPRMSDVPLMHIEVIPTENPPTGAGQMATPLVTPVIGNAIAQLTGVRLRHAPFTPERIKKALT
jgi:isoquinoline 1-oxidoreductase beta subunit